ncbi:hypothetical protein [Metamycoplasma equirhinis]|uniref:hypothetical protein n=1 Tax=Metamycoplasma equirhinis TaxID=92402 RepID=UPI003593B26D
MTHNPYTIGIAIGICCVIVTIILIIVFSVLMHKKHKRENSKDNEIENSIKTIISDFANSVSDARYITKGDYNNPNGKNKFFINDLLVTEKCIYIFKTNNFDCLKLDGDELEREWQIETKTKKINIPNQITPLKSQISNLGKIVPKNTPIVGVLIFKCDAEISIFNKPSYITYSAINNLKNTLQEINESLDFSMSAQYIENILSNILKFKQN